METNFALEVLDDFIKIAIPSIIGFLAGISGSLISRKLEIKKIELEKSESNRKDINNMLNSACDLLSEYSAAVFSYFYSKVSELEKSEDKDIINLDKEISRNVFLKEINIKRTIAILGLLKAEREQELVLQYDNKITEILGIRILSEQKTHYNELREMEKKIYLSIGEIRNK